MGSAVRLDLHLTINRLGFREARDVDLKYLITRFGSVLVDFF